ncbi:hypothetical protein Bbelb_111410 [Branchiostoma belcheri]|nr:hypothetical protein Bbelb_111410 [Branchiostoma belcheri]
MPVLSTDGNQTVGDVRHEESPPPREDGELPSDGEKDNASENGSVRSGSQSGDKKKNGGGGNVVSPPEVRISALEQGFHALSDKLDVFQEMIMAQFNQQTSRKRRAASPETVPEIGLTCAKLQRDNFR